MAFPKRFSLNFAKSMPFAPLYSISMQYFYPNAISFRLFYRIKRKFKTLLFHRYQILRQYTRSAGSRTYSCLFGIQMHCQQSITFQFIDMAGLLQ